MNLSKLTWEACNWVKEAWTLVAVVTGLLLFLAGAVYDHHANLQAGTCFNPVHRQLLIELGGAIH